MRFCNAMTVPQELEERWFPIVFSKYEAWQDSCGHGMTRGGFALVREFDVQADETLTIHGDRELFPPFGISGGTNAGGCSLIINKDTREERDIGMYATGVALKKGDHVYYTSAGGGGFGNPLERDPENVLEDVKDEWLSLECARDWYGVIIDEVDAEACDYRIDWDSTKKMREELKVKGISEGFGPHEVHPFGKDIKPAWVPTQEEVLPHITISRPPGW